MLSWKWGTRMSITGVKTLNFDPAQRRFYLTERTRTSFGCSDELASSRQGFFRHNCGGISE